MRHIESSAVNLKNQFRDFEIVELKKICDLSFHLKDNSSPKDFTSKEKSMFFFKLKTDCTVPTFFGNHTAKISLSAQLLRFLLSTFCFFFIYITRNSGHVTF